MKGEAESEIYYCNCLQQLSLRLITETETETDTANANWNQSL